MTAWSSSRAVERPLAPTSRVAISGSGSAIEQRLHARGLGPVAHERRVRARTEREPQRVDQQALAGTRLAGQHVQPRLELEPEPLDQREVRERDSSSSVPARGDPPFRRPS